MVQRFDIGNFRSGITYIEANSPIVVKTAMLPMKEKR